MFLQGVTCTTISSVTYYEIDLKNKNLSGPLPNNLASISTLTKLYISFFLTVTFESLALGRVLQDNQFTGTLPASWNSFSALDELNLRDNLLTGALPNSWSSMTSITIL